MTKSTGVKKLILSADAIEKMEKVKALIHEASLVLADVRQSDYDGFQRVFRVVISKESKGNVDDYPASTFHYLEETYGVVIRNSKKV